MLARLIAACLSQRLLLAALTALLLGVGIWAAIGLPIDAFPDISSTQVKVIMKAPGMTPEEVETRITAPIEQELLGIPGQTMLRSRSKYAIADITLDFDDDTDIYWARQQVSERLAGVLDSLPSPSSGGLAPITTPLSDMYMFTLEGPQSLEEKRTVLDWTMRPQLRGLPGVADVNSLGGFVRSFEVVPDILRALGPGPHAGRTARRPDAQQPQRRRRPAARERGSLAAARRRRRAHARRRREHRRRHAWRRAGARRRRRRGAHRRADPLWHGDAAGRRRGRRRAW